MINKTVIFAFFVFVTLASKPSWADTKSKYDNVYSKCISESGTINNAIVHLCSENTSLLVKKDMNKLYGIIYKKLSKRSSEDAKKFETSQKLWLKYRKKHCELMGDYVGSPMYSHCPMELNKFRVNELTVLAE